VVTARERRPARETNEIQGRLSSGIVQKPRFAEVGRFMKGSLIDVPGEVRGFVEDAGDFNDVAIYAIEDYRFSDPERPTPVG
jgi:hypothetical protein